MSQRLRRDSAVMPLPVTHVGAGALPGLVVPGFARTQLKSICHLLLRLRAGFALGLGVHASTQALTMLVV
jgi:hypothetical protein